MPPSKNNSTGKNGKVSVKDLPISSIIFSGKVKFKKLAKSTLIFSFPPALIILIFCMNGYIDFFEGIVLFGAIFLVALMSNYPYIADLQEVTMYVEDLVDNKNPEQPELSFLNNVEELSSSIQKLNNSWQDKNDALKVLLLEDEILINSLPNIVLMLDAELNFLQTNQAAKNIFGWKFNETIAQIIADEQVMNLCRKVMETGEGFNLKYEIGQPYFFFNIRAEKFPINSPNKIAVILILQNLTDEKKTEKLLNDFVANASHEMKTPLASISGFIETLSEVENDPDAEREFLKIMKEQSDRMNRLINDLLVLSVAESGAGRAENQPLDILDLIQESMLSHMQLALNKNIEIKTMLEGNLPQIIGNRDEILRVFDNLISNAVKYSSNDNAVVVSAVTTNNSEKKFREFTSNQPLICISVQDFGEGIDEKYIPRLTERFFRVDKARSRDLGGTGLGLSIVSQIVGNHNGVLEILSEKDKGSTFRVCLPFTPDYPAI